MESLAYRLRLRHLMYGYWRLLQFAAVIDNSFRELLAEKPFSFVMTSGENTTARYFFCDSGRLRSSTRPRSVDFKLIWRDNRTGGKIMLDMLRGKPKVLYNAVANGDLQLEGDAQTVSRYMRINGRLDRVFRKKKKKRPENSDK